MLLLDTYNILHAAPRVHSGFAGLNLAGLVRLLEDSPFRSAATLICDGSRARPGIDDRFLHPDAPIRVVFAGPGKDADALIERLVIDAGHRGRAAALTIVSSDKGVLASAVSPIGARPRRMTSEHFLRLLLSAAESSARSPGSAATESDRPALDADAANRWLREFGFTPDPVRSGHEAPPRGSTPSPAAGPPTSEPAAPADWPDGINPDDLDMRKWLGNSGA